MKYYIDVDRGMGVKTWAVRDSEGDVIKWHTKRKYARRHKRALNQSAALLRDEIRTESRIKHWPGE